jgi:A/G-specific adenine glycosylase
MALPRVGRYVANTTVCLVRNERVPSLDRNVERVYERFFGSDWPDSESAQWDFAAEMLPAETPRQFNMALLDFGALVCQPDPNCESCPLSSECSYYRREVGSR